MAIIALAALRSPTALGLFLLSGLVGSVIIWRHQVFEEFIVHNSIRHLPAFACFTSTASREKERKKENEEARTVEEALLHQS